MIREFKRSATNTKPSCRRVVQVMKATHMAKRRSTSLAAIAALFIGALTASASLAQAQATQNGNSQVAQDTRGDDYLPPWQRGKNAQGSEDGPGAPQRITPQQRSDPAPAPAPAPLADTYSARPSGDTTAAYRDPPPPDYRGGPGYAPPPPYEDDTYSSNEIVGAGHRFFGGVSKGLASVVEHAFEKQGRPNGYVLGDEAGGAFVAGLRYGEGTLYTKNAGVHRVYWQGPSFGYDFGAEGSKTMILVYNLRSVDQIFNRFAGVDGSAYFVGGVGVTFQTYDDVVLAPIRSGVGLRLGANVGYLKYTRTPTWNPF
jgi:hypothetical protein